MFIAWLFTSLAFAQPNQVVAMGDGLVAAAPEAQPAEPAATAGEPKTQTVDKGMDKPAPVAGGWISALADCLDETAPAQWTVADHSRVGETAKSAMDRIDAALTLAPKVVVVGVGAQELAEEAASPDVFAAEVTTLIAALQVEGTQKPSVILVGVVPPNAEQITDDKPDQAKANQRTETWNAVLATLATASDSVHHVDLWKEWPREGADRAKLTVDGWRLSHQGHARVAAAVCDTVQMVIR